MDREEGEGVVRYEARVGDDDGDLEDNVEGVGAVHVEDEDADEVFIDFEDVSNGEGVEDATALSDFKGNVGEE